MIFGIDIVIFVFIVLCLSLVAIFEFINGFHDTANAVAPVIYTHSLKPKQAVLLSGIMNFLGVILGGIGVAMSIIRLLPLEAIGYQSTGFGIIVVVSFLLSAIIWNFATWYRGLPASSSHTLIGSILGVSIAMMFVPVIGDIEVVPNWKKAIEIIESLFISPLFGFSLAILIMLLAYKFISDKYYFSTPEEHYKPKKRIRTLLIASSAWVSFAHGSNDGQKGIGIAVLILVILAPSVFAINPKINLNSKLQNVEYIQEQVESIDVNELNDEDKKFITITKNNLHVLNSIIYNSDVGELDKVKLRLEILKFQKNVKKLGEIKKINLGIGNVYGGSALDYENIKSKSINELVNKSDFKKNVDSISGIIDYSPTWVVILISISLGLGTMIGWKRIVITIGERIGNTKMNYAQATTSSMITAFTITMASKFHLPVSTTHILSSSVAGTMFVGEKSEGQRKKSLRGDTVKSILIAWILTLPVTMLLSFTIFFTLWFIFIK